MAADAREQTASCDAFVLSRRLPVPGAPPCRKSPACLIARTRPSSYLLSPERHLPRMVPAASAAPGVSPFRHFRSYLTLPPTLHGPLRHPPLPGVSRFRRIGSYLRRVTRAPSPALWRRAPGACAERGLVRTRSHQAEPQKLSPRSRKAGLVRTGTEAFGSTKNRLQSEVEGSR